MEAKIEALLAQAERDQQEVDRRKREKAGSNGDADRAKEQ